MNADTNVEPALATENTLADAAIEIPDAAESETPASEVEKPEPTEAELKAAAAEREAKALKRRVDRLTRDKYQTQAELEQLRRTAQPQEKPANQPLTEDDVHRRAQEISHENSIAEKCNGLAKAGEKQFPGFLDKFKDLSDEIPTFLGPNRPTPFMEAILDSDNPAALINHLADNPDIASELADLSPRQQIRQLALIERDMGVKTIPKPSNAPSPLSPVKPAAAGGKPDPEKDPEAWIAMRNAQVRKR